MSRDYGPAYNKFGYNNKQRPLWQYHSHRVKRAESDWVFPDSNLRQILNRDKKLDQYVVRFYDGVFVDDPIKKPVLVPKLPEELDRVTYLKWHNDVVHYYEEIQDCIQEDLNCIEWWTWLLAERIIGSDTILRYKNCARSHDETDLFESSLVPGKPGHQDLLIVRFWDDTGGDANYLFVNGARKFLWSIEVKNTQNFLNDQWNFFQQKIDEQYARTQNKLIAWLAEKHQNTEHQSVSELAEKFQNTEHQSVSSKSRAKENQKTANKSVSSKSRGIASLPTRNHNPYSVVLSPRLSSVMSYPLPTSVTNNPDKIYPGDRRYIHSDFFATLMKKFLYDNDGFPGEEGLKLRKIIWYCAYDDHCPDQDMYRILISYLSAHNIITIDMLKSSKESNFDDWAKDNLHCSLRTAASRAFAQLKGQIPRYQNKDLSHPHALYKFPGWSGEWGDSD